MAEYVGLPRERMHVVYPGIEPAGQAMPQSERRRAANSNDRLFRPHRPEKGLHLLVDAFILLRKMPDAPRCRLRVAGWLGKHNRRLSRRHSRQTRGTRA